MSNSKFEYAFYLDTTRCDSEGRSQVRIRIHMETKRFFRPTGVFLQESEWHPRLQMPDPGCIQFALIMEELEKAWEKLSSWVKREFPEYASFLTVNPYADPTRKIQSGGKVRHNRKTRFTITLALKDTDVNPAGELPVILCVSDGKRLAERETGITLSRLGWNEKLGWLCTTYPYYSAYSDHLLDELIEAYIALGLPVDRKRLSALCSSTSDLDSRIHEAKANRSLLHKEWKKERQFFQMDESLEDKDEAKYGIDAVQMVFMLSHVDQKSSHYPLKLRLTCGEGEVFLDTGIQMREKDWDPVNQCPIEGYPDREAALIKMRDTRYEAEMALRLGVGKTKLPNVFRLAMKADAPFLVGDFVEHLILQLDVEERYGSRRLYKTALHEMRQIFGNLDFSFEWLDLKALKKIEAALRKRGLNDISIHGRFRTIRTFWNKAIQANIASVNDYPFLRFKMKRFKQRSMHRSLTKEEIYRIINFKPEENDSPWMTLATDIFAFSYYSAGINFVDICHLKKENIVGETLIYERMKTKKEIRIPLRKESLALIEKYAPRSQGYLFPFLNTDKDDSVWKRSSKCHTYLKKINEVLREIGERLELPVKLTTYVSRHSFATVLKHSGVKTEMISELMGHASITTTQIYIDAFKAEDMLEMQKLLY